MMSETITLQALDLSGETLSLFLRKSDGTLLNTGGDAMTEAGSTGVFTATLAESRTSLGPLAVRVCAGAETADNLLYDGFLVEGSTVIDSTVAAVLDSASIDAIWNEVLTGATHNIAASAGRRLRQLADTVVLVDGVCDAASNAGTDSTGTITLAVGTTTACVGQAIRCENQVRYIASYNAGTRVAQLDRPWCVVPDAGDEYVIFNVRNPLVGLASLALAGSTAAAVNDVLVDTGTTLPAQIAGISAGSGTGARTVTITVNDGTTALQNATVRMTEGANTFTATTNVSGVAVFNLDDATYTVGVTKSGYSYAGTTLVVNGTETATYSMTVVSITPPADPALCAVTIHIRDQYGADLANQPVEITWVQWDATADQTPPVLSIPPVQTTNASGEVSVNLYRLAVYKIIYGDGRDARRWDGTIPDAGSYEVAL
jgi:hypothetical protein